MSSKMWYRELGRAYLAMVVRKGFSVKMTFEQTWENEPILWRAERRIRAKALRQKDKLLVFEEQKASQYGWSLLIWVGGVCVGWLKVLEGLEGVR